MISAGDFRNGVTIEFEGNITRLLSSSTLNLVKALLSLEPS